MKRRVDTGYPDSRRTKESVDGKKNVSSEEDRKKRKTKSQEN